jgi:hypothetical protein
VDVVEVGVEARCVFGLYIELVVSIGGCENMGETPDPLVDGAEFDWAITPWSFTTAAVNPIGCIKL